MAKKDFKREINNSASGGGIDALIQNTEVPEADKTTKTSVELSENLYIEFKSKVLLPQKITLREYLATAMRKSIDEISE